MERSNKGESLPGPQQTRKTGGPETFTATINRLWSSNRALNGLSTKSSHDLGRNLLSNMGQIDHDMLPKPWSNL